MDRVKGRKMLSEIAGQLEAAVILVLVWGASAFRNSDWEDLIKYLTWRTVN